MRKKRRDVVGAGGSVLRLKGGKYLEKIDTRECGESGCGPVIESWVPTTAQAPGTTGNKTDMVEAFMESAVQELRQIWIK